MEDLKEKSTNTQLMVIKDAKHLAKKRKKSKIVKILSDIVLIISKLVLKLTVIVAIYSMVFSVAVYYSNKFMVEKLRESEAHRKIDPVLEALRKDKSNDKNEEGKKTEDKKQEDKNKEKQK